MKYYLPAFDCSKFPKIFAGSRSRHATATAVSHISKDKMVIAHFLGRQLYYIDMSNGYKIKHHTKTTYYHDLIDYQSNTLITSNFPSMEFRDGTLSVYDVTNEFSLKKHITFPGIKCHGCRFLDDDIAIVTSVGDFKRGLLFVNLITDEVELFDDFDYFPKDIFIENDKLFIITSASRPDRSPVEILDSMIYVYDVATRKRLSEFKFYGQTDAMTKSDDDILITLQGQHCLAHLKYNGESLEYVGNIGGFDFPHGISSFDGNICVTNYGDNSFEIFDRIDNLYKEKMLD